MRYRIRAVIEFDSESRADALQILGAIDITHPDLELEFVLRSPEWVPPAEHMQHLYRVIAEDGRVLAISAESELDAERTARDIWGPHSPPGAIFVRQLDAVPCSICRREHGPQVQHASE